MKRQKMFRRVPTAVWQAFAGVLLLIGMIACSSRAPERELGTASEALTPLPTNLDCGSTAAWIETNKDRLPADYDVLVSYPLSVRRAIVAALSPEEKSRLWSTHVQRFRTSREHVLSPDQKAMIQSALDALSPEMFGVSPPADGVRNAMSDMEAKAISVFGKDDARRLFATLGSEESEEAEARGAAAPTCTCAVNDDWCTNDTYCSYDYENCVGGGARCGWFWQELCDGRCKSRAR